MSGFGAIPWKAEVEGRTLTDLIKTANAEVLSFFGEALEWGFLTTIQVGGTITQRDIAGVEYGKVTMWESVIFVSHATFVKHWERMG